MTATARVSVVVPVRDGAAFLPDLLRALRAQQEVGRPELVAIDSGSRDGSRELLREGGARVLEIAAGAFDHGSSRNLGVIAATAPLVCFLSQDALPADAGCLARLADALEARPEVAGASARQLPRPDADPLTRRDLESWVTASEQPRVVSADDWERVSARPPLERYRAAAFDNVCSIARRDLLLAHPFEASRFGEDLEWSVRMLRLGHAIGYVPEARVYHSHSRSARSLYRRNYLGHRLLARLFGLSTIPGRAELLRAAVGAVISDLRTLARASAGPRAWLRAPAEALAASYGQYRGARDERLGRPYPGWA